MAALDEGREKSAATIVRRAGSYSNGQGTRHPLDATVRHVQGQRISHAAYPHEV
jgi:hypothetical protein